MILSIILRLIAGSYEAMLSQSLGLGHTMRVEGVFLAICLVSHAKVSE